MKFDRPVGAAADVKELEYVCALHQTQDDENWMDGSIEPLDVVYFLRSRYGIYVDEDQVKKIIFKGLAGGDSEDDCLDMMEMAAVLIIPLLLKVSQKDAQTVKQRIDFQKQRDYNDYLKIREKMKALEPPNRIIADVLRNILKDSEFYDEVGTIVHPKITPAVVRKIFGVYDELELIVDDELVNDMVALASGGDASAVLDEEAFARALTNDVKLYDPENEVKLSTEFSDVFGTNSRNNKIRKERDEALESDVDINQVDTRQTLSQIDFTADNIRSTIHVILTWIILIGSYMVYIYERGGSLKACHMDPANFGCKIANSVTFWLQQMVLLITCGIVVGTSLSFGNGLLSDSVFGPLLGIAAVIIFVFLPLFIEIDLIFIVTQVIDDQLTVLTFRWINLISGVLMILLQIQNLIAICVSEETIAMNNLLATFLLGNNMKSAFRMKQAASIKVNKLVKNAYDLHEHNESDERKDIKKNLLGEKATRSTQETALLNYTKIVEKTEEYGGLFWGWKQYLTGDIQSEEGVWLHSRLIAGNAIQFTTTFVLFMGYIQLTSFLSSVVDTVDVMVSGIEGLEAYELCRPRFNSKNCYFPHPPTYIGAGFCRMDDLPTNCTSTDGPLIPVEQDGDAWLFQELCTEANNFFEASTYSQSMNYMESENPRCFDFLNKSLDEIVSVYIECKAYDLCQKANVELINGYDPCQRLYYPNCTAVVNEIDSKIIDEAQDTVNNINSTQAAECVDLLGLLVSKFLTTDFCTSFGLYRPQTPITAIATDGTCETIVSFCLTGEHELLPDNSTGSRTGKSSALCLLGIHPETHIPFNWRGCKDNPDVQPMLSYYDSVIRPTAETWLPEPWLIRVTFGVATTVATMAALSICFVYIPSAIHTILKFRSGAIPSLRDPYFINYRKSLHLSTFMIGAMFWGLLVSTVVLAVLVAGAVFVVLWPITQPFLGSLLATIIGIFSTLILKIVVCIYVGKLSFTGLYRKRPVLSNIFSLALECWHLALTVLSLIMRFVKFLITAGLYVGRIDRPILQKDLMVDLDSMPKAFRQDMLMAEAHHHPYLERLGIMYMMKLRYGDQFASTAGATWRLLFITSLMPWLRKHRIQDEKFDIHCDALHSHIKTVKEKIGNDDFEIIESKGTTGEEQIEVSPGKSVRSDVGYLQVE